jgi:GH25 family lysozyme M1 (1,4-beta-N-acetylmuramidase)
MMTPSIHGIDVSHWNRPADFGLIPQYDLISLKASEGRRGRDETFRYRWEQIRNRGTKYRGAYHWIRSDSPISAQVDNVLAATGTLQRGEFIQCDWETTGGIALVTAEQAQEFCDRINTIMYSSDWLPDSTLDADSRGEFYEWRDANPDFPYWHANYNTSDRPTGGWAECVKYSADVWQWSSTTIVPGFAGGIDVNHVFNWAALDLVSDQTPVVDIPQLILPEEHNNMKVIIEDPVWKGLFTVDGTPLSAEVAAELVKQGFVVVKQDHEFWRAAVAAKLGPQALELYTRRALS